MARLTKAQKMEKAEKFVGITPDPNATSLDRIGRLAVAFNKKRKEFDEMEVMIGSIIGNLLSEPPRG